jgi:hypothetical protein
LRWEECVLACPSLSEFLVVQLVAAVQARALRRLHAYARRFFPSDPEDVICDAILEVVARPCAYLVKDHPLTEAVMIRYLAAIVRRLGLARSRRETVRGRVIAANVDRWHRRSDDPAEVARWSEESRYARESIIGTGA